MKLRLFLSRLSWPAFCVVMILQRSPLVRYLSQLEHSLIPRVQHIWTVVVGAVTVGAYNTVTGASGDVIFDSRFDNVTSVTIGDEVEIVLDIDGGNHTPGTWEVRGDLPGIDFNIAGGTLAFRGTPDQTGSFPIEVSAWRGQNMNGAQGDDLAFTLVISPLIDQQPVTQEVDFGGSVQLDVTLNTTGQASYQWQKQNSENAEQFDDLEGQTGPSLSLENASLADTGMYRVVVAVGEIQETSDVVTITVNSSIQQQPVSLAADWNSDAELAVVMVSPEGATYQWQKQNADDPEIFDDIPGQTGSTLNFTGVRLADAGTYRVTTTSGESVEISDPAVLTVNTSPLQAWLETYFEDPFGADTALDLDPDMDMLINAVEFTFGLDPNAMQKEALVKTTQEDIDGVVHAVYTFPPVAEGSESVVSLEGNATPDTAGWTTLVNGVDGVIVESTAEAYVVKLPAATRQFNRLRIVTE